MTRSIPKRVFSFQEMINDAVNRTIVELLGENAAKSLYKYLEDEQGITRDRIPQRLATLFSILQGKLGIAGRTTGRAIIRNLYRGLGLKFAENPDYELPDYVEEALFEYVKEIMRLSD